LDGDAVGSPYGGLVGPDLPEIVFVPAHPDTRPGHETDVVFEVRQVEGGDPALPAFTTLERLVSVLGHEQPWVALPLLNIQQIMGSVQVEQIVLDPEAESGTWRWQASDLEALERRQ
jgi:hypothetical protein